MEVQLWIRIENFFLSKNFVMSFLLARLLYMIWFIKGKFVQPKSADAGKSPKQIFFGFYTNSCKFTKRRRGSSHLASSPYTYPYYNLLLRFNLLLNKNESSRSLRPAYSRPILSPRRTVPYYYFRMHCRLTDSKFLRRLPHRRVVVYDVIGYGYCPFFNIFLHGSAPENVFYIIFLIHSSYDNSTISR